MTKDKETIIVAAAAPSANNELQELVKLLLDEKKREIKKEEDRYRRILEAAAREGAAAREAVILSQSRCTHRNQKNETRLRGQYMPDGRLCLICVWCGKNFWKPAREGEAEIPPSLMPDSDSIGG